MRTVTVQSLQQLLQQSFRDHAGSRAVICGERSVYYEELDQSAARIASYLKSQQIPSLSFIGISVSDRVDFITAMLGVIMYRCVFVPLDPKLPVARVKTMIGKLGLKYIITDDAANEQLYNKEAAAPVSFYQINNINETQRVILNTAEDYHPNDPLYVYFTSGSTGEPKAVVGKNESLVHFINWEIDTFKVDHTWRVSQFINPGFDACLRDYFVPLLAGGAICIMPDIDKNIYEADLTRWIDENKINLIHCVPSFFKLINNDLVTKLNYSSLKYILLSGEQLQLPQLKKWYDRLGDSVQLVNLYGTTETTLVKTYYMVQPEDVDKGSIPVGRAIRDTEILVLDDKMNPCGVNEPGDIYFSTPYMTFGYFNDQLANDQKFIRHQNKKTSSSSVIYRTGDTGKWLEDGNLALLGRKDRQIKVRGIRVEPGEIEKVILQHPDIKEAVVAVKEDNNKEPLLVVYYTGKEQPGMEVLHEYVSRHLPVYMSPHYYIYVPQIPLTPNGKTDVNALPSPFEQNVRRTASLRNQQEELLAELWSQLLNIRKQNIGSTDNFFFLGGNSIQVLQLLSKILERFNCRMSLEAFLKHPTIAGCSSYIDQQHVDKDDQLLPVAEAADYAITYGQARIFKECFGQKDSTNFNMPNVIEIAGHIDAAFCESVFAQVVRRYPIFRTSFHMRKGEPRQVVNENPEFQFRYIQSQPERLWDDIRSCIQPFDLEKAPLIRVGLIELSPVKQMLVVDIHHIVIDALSARVLERDLINLFRKKELADVKLHYKDFAEWQQSEPQRRVRQQQEEYWINRFSHPAPLLMLPLNRERPTSKNFEGAIYKFYADSEEVASIVAYARKKEVTPFTVLLACYYVLLHKLSDAEDIVVGIPSSGRSHPATADMIGLFVGELALRSTIDPANSFHVFLQQLNNDSIDAFKNQDFQYRDLKEKMQPAVAEGRNALFDVWFAFQKLVQPQVEVTESITFIKKINDNTTALFDLLLRAYETDNEIEFRFEYATSLFNRDTIEHFAIYYKNILQQVIRNDREPVNKIDIRQLEESMQ